jgi:phosphatidylserine/phosphatidylglycerophosphate/cardiolipin synthase-like enzyme
VSDKDHKPMESVTLESPFITGELFTGEGAVKEFTGLAALQAESPFQRDFEESTRFASEPERYEEQAAWPEAESFPLQAGEPQEKGPDHDLHSGEKHAHAVPRRSLLRVPEEREWFGEADVAEADGETDDGPLQDLEDAGFEDDTPAAQIEEALARSDWNAALQLAIQAGERDESKLTNLLFFARHKELERDRKLDTKTNKADQKLAQEWTRIRDREVWAAIEKSAKNAALAVDGKDVASEHRLFWGTGGKQFKQLVEWAAQEVDLDPGLLATALIAETGGIASYLTKSKVSTYLIGVDDFFAMRHVLAQNVPAYSKIGWDKKQKPSVHLNDAQTNPREVQTIWFNSGRNGLLATAVYLKYSEIRLRDDAKKAGGDFDALPIETRFALIRMSMAAGRAGAATRLKRALRGDDILVRNYKPTKAYQTDRNATIRAAQALHISDWIFGNKPAPSTQPETDESQGRDEEWEGRSDLVSDLTNENDESLDEFEVATIEGYADDSEDGLVHHEFDPRLARLAHQSPFARVSTQTRKTDPIAPESETYPDRWAFENERSMGNEDESPHALDIQLEENEFRLNRLPPKVQQHFSKGGTSWRDAVAEAISAGIRDPNYLADLIFFMQYPARMKVGVGKPIDINEKDVFKLRVEWNLYRTIATGLLKPATAKPARAVFLPVNPSRNYEDYVAAPTTGRIELMINGRNGSGPNSNQTEAFDSMQRTVESLGPNDSIFLAAWQFTPTEVPLTVNRSGGMTTWADLFKSKAKDGVKIRIIISHLPPLAADYMSDLKAVDKIIGELPSSVSNNFKYIASKHPADLVASHHQKFMLVKKGMTVTAYCGGLDISRNRTPAGWGPNFVWHDIHAKLEGLIARDLEREFVLRWNREKAKSTASRLPGWKDLENLAQTPVNSVDKEVVKNTHKLQILRTVSVGTHTKDIKRDDIWQGYFRLIGCATHFIFMENQYFHEPKMADAIVKQAQAQLGLIVIIVAGSITDDKVNPLTRHMLAMRHEFFTRLFAGLAANRLRVYTMAGRLVHSKLILVDDQALSMGSANANPRGFFLDTELNVTLDDAEAVKNFRHRLWSHDLGVPATGVAAWTVPGFMAQWDTVAKANEGLKKSSDQMAGEGVIPFDPRTAKGERYRFIQDVFT